MPLYEYYCRTCAGKFELLRPASRADEPAACPQGHTGAARTLSVFVAFAKRGGSPQPMPSGAGCACGGAGCGCAH